MALTSGSMAILNHVFLLVISLKCQLVSASEAAQDCADWWCGIVLIDDVDIVLGRWLDIGIHMNGKQNNMLANYFFCKSAHKHSAEPALKPCLLHPPMLQHNTKVKWFRQLYHILHARIISWIASMFITLTLTQPWICRDLPTSLQMACMLLFVDILCLSTITFWDGI